LLNNLFFLMANDHSGFKALGDIDMNWKNISRGILTAVMTNRSGGALVQGDVVVIDPNNDRSVITTTTAGYELGVGVVQIGGDNLASVDVIFAGYIPRMKTTANAGTGRGQFLKTSTTAKKAQLSGTSGGAGDFAVAITHAGGDGFLAAIFKTPEVY
jgi:hypothetical protein